LFPAIAATRVGILFVLFLAAGMEVLGDAAIRLALKSSPGAARVAFFAAGALILFLYGCFVNQTPWDFGRQLGAYVAIFYVVSQLVSLCIFKEQLQLSTFLGGGLIVAGGLILWFSNR
jgi:drug/metabolite transporter superfamily protein YnfA